MTITLCVCVHWRDHGFSVDLNNNSEVLLIEVMLGWSLAMTMGVVSVIDSE